MNEIEIIQITDLHLNANKFHIAHDINPYNSAQIIIDEVIEEHKNVNSLILTGDLVDDESREGYGNLSRLLAEVHDKCQIFLMPGLYLCLIQKKIILQTGYYIKKKLIV